MNECLTYKVSEVARILGCSVGVTWQAVHDGTLPSRKVGHKRIVIPRAALEEWLAEAGRKEEAAV